MERSTLNNNFNSIPCKGWTLIETMVSIAVLIILAAVSMSVNTNALRRREAVKNTANYIMSGLEQQKSKAITLNEWRSIECNISILSSSCHIFKYSDFSETAELVTNVNIPLEIRNRLQGLFILVDATQLYPPTGSVDKAIIFPPSVKESVYRDSLTTANKLSGSDNITITIYHTDYPNFQRKIVISPNGYMEMTQ